MAQGKIIIETSEVISASQKIEGLAQNYHDAYMELYRIIDSIQTAGDWQGTDNDVYTQQIYAFKNDFVAMEQLMNAYADFLRTSANGYKTVQKYTTDAVAKKLSTSAN